MTSSLPVMIPDQLKGRGFRFTRLLLSREDGKAPIDSDYYDGGALEEDDSILLAHLEEGNGYGLITNYGNLLAFDADERRELEALGIMARLPPTLTDEAPNKPDSQHLYYICEGLTKPIKLYHPTKTVEVGEGEIKVINRLEVGQIQAGRAHIVGPNSPHHKGGRREIVDNSPVLEITIDDLREITRGLAFDVDTNKSPTFEVEAGLVEKSPAGGELEEIARKARRGRGGDLSLSERIGDIRRVLSAYAWSPNDERR